MILALMCLVVLVLSANIAFATTTAPASQPSDEALQQTLHDLAQQAATIKDLSADFTQSQNSMLLQKPLVSQGRVNVRGSQTRWLTTKPQPLGMSTHGSELRLYYPQQHRVEVYKLDERLAQLVASPLPRLKTLEHYFHIQRQPVDKNQPNPSEHTLDLLLTPRGEAIANHVKQIQARLNTKTGLAQRLIITNAEDELTVITFSHVQINPGLSDDDLVLHLPNGTDIVHPLQTTE